MTKSNGTEKEILTTTTLSQHPISAAFPAMPEDEFAALVTDIKTRGQRLPITVYEGQVLDGWHRYRACRELGLTPTVVEFTGSVEEAVGLVISLNARRRHLDTGQLALFTLEYLLPRFEAEAQERQRAGTKAVPTDLCAPGRTGGRRRHRASADAAKSMGVSSRSVERAKYVRTHGTAAEIAAVRRGSRPLTAVAKDVRERIQQGQSNGKKTPKSRAGAPAVPMPPAPPEVVTALTALRRDLDEHIKEWPGDHPKYLIGTLESAVELVRMIFAVRTTCVHFRPAIDPATRTLALPVVLSATGDEPGQRSTDDSALAPPTPPTPAPTASGSNPKTARQGPVALRDCAVGDRVRLESGEVVEIELLNACRARVCPVPAGESIGPRGRARDIAPSAPVVAVISHEDRAEELRKDRRSGSSAPSPRKRRRSG
jgi:hypothetical protein